MCRSQEAERGGGGGFFHALLQTRERQPIALLIPASGGSAHLLLLEAEGRRPQVVFGHGPQLLSFLHSLSLFPSLTMSLSIPHYVSLHPSLSFFPSLTMSLSIPHYVSFHPSLCLSPSLTLPLSIPHYVSLHPSLCLSPSVTMSLSIPHYVSLPPPSTCSAWWSGFLLGGFSVPSRAASELVCVSRRVPLSDLSPSLSLWLVCVCRGDYGLRQPQPVWTQDVVHRRRSPERVPPGYDPFPLHLPDSQHMEIRTITNSPAPLSPHVLHQTPFVPVDS